jgi:hypothetical protein
MLEVGTNRLQTSAPEAERRSLGRLAIAIGYAVAWAMVAG